MRFFPPSLPSLFVKMFLSSSLLSLLLVVASVANVGAAPCQRGTTSILHFAAKISNVGVKNVADIDRQRVAHHRAISQFNKGSSKRNSIEGVTDPTAVQYTASVGIGSPATQCKFLP